MQCDGAGRTGPRQRNRERTGYQGGERGGRGHAAVGSADAMPCWVQWRPDQRLQLVHQQQGMCLCAGCASGSRAVSMAMNEAISILTGLSRGPPEQARASGRTRRPFPFGACKRVLPWPVNRRCHCPRDPLCDAAAIRQRDTTHPALQVERDPSPVRIHHEQMPSPSPTPPLHLQTTSLNAG